MTYGECMREYKDKKLDTIGIVTERCCFINENGCYFYLVSSVLWNRGDGTWELRRNPHTDTSRISSFLGCSDFGYGKVTFQTELLYVFEMGYLLEQYYIYYSKYRPD